MMPSMTRIMFLVTIAIEWSLQASLVVVEAESFGGMIINQPLFDSNHTVGASITFEVGCDNSLLPLDSSGCIQGFAYYVYSYPSGAKVSISTVDGYPAADPSRGSIYYYDGRFCPPPGTTGTHTIQSDALVEGKYYVQAAYHQTSYSQWIKFGAHFNFSVQPAVPSQGTGSAADSTSSSSGLSSGGTIALIVCMVVFGVGGLVGMIVGCSIYRQQAIKKQDIQPIPLNEMVDAPVHQASSSPNYVNQVNSPSIQFSYLPSPTAPMFSSPIQTQPMRSPVTIHPIPIAPPPVYAYTSPININQIHHVNPNHTNAISEPPHEISSQPLLHQPNESPLPPSYEESIQTMN